MNQQTSIKAKLIDKNGETYGLKIKLLSKYHLHVDEFTGPLKQDMAFEHIILEIDGRSFKLGDCRLHRVPSTGEYELYFLNNIYNLETLLQHTRYIDIKPHFQNLKLIWSKQQKIIPEFKEYILRLNYELNCYKEIFDQFEIELQKEKHVDFDQLQHAVMKSEEGINFLKYFDNSLDELKSLIKDFSKKEHADHGFFMRKQLRGIIRCSDFLERTNIKPRGYSGDSEMMRMLYENGYRGRRIFEKLLYYHAIQTDTAQAVRNRVDLVSAFIYKVSEEMKPKKFRFMSVACGPALEMYELFKNESAPQKYQIVFLDQDSQAIREAHGVISSIEKKINFKLDVKFMTDSIRTVLDTPDLPGRFGKFHFIYSLGLFDYLTPNVARAVLNKLFELLHPGGEIMIGNFHVRNSQRWYMSYWMDWNLYYRTEEELLNLLEASDCAEKHVFFEDTNNQMFLYAVKR